MNQKIKEIREVFDELYWYLKFFGLKVWREGLSGSLAPARELPPRPFTVTGWTAANVAKEAIVACLSAFCFEKEQIWSCRLKEEVRLQMGFGSCDWIFIWHVAKWDLGRQFGVSLRRCHVGRRWISLSLLIWRKILNLALDFVGLFFFL